MRTNDVNVDWERTLDPIIIVIYSLVSKRNTSFILNKKSLLEREMIFVSCSYCGRLPVITHEGPGWQGLARTSKTLKNTFEIFPTIPAV